MLILNVISNSSRPLNTFLWGAEHLSIKPTLVSKWNVVRCCMCRVIPVQTEHVLKQLYIKIFSSVFDLVYFMLLRQCVIYPRRALNHTM